jgi:UDP-2,3-diacylglucosamine hydrolase
MSIKPVYLASDVHLGTGDPGREARFVRWLHHAGARASHIVVNGDLFDFWFEYRTAIPRGHARVLGALAEVVDAGLPVTLMGGNHDWWGGSFLTHEIGVAFLRDPTILDLAGHRTLLAHGDGLGRGDLGYRFLRAILRGRGTRWAFRWLHPDVGAWVARRVSRTDEREEGGDPAVGRPAALRRWAEQALREDPSLQLVALGHTHVPELVEVEPGRFYLNSGDWLHHDSYAVLAPGEPPVLQCWKG